MFCHHEKIHTGEKFGKYAEVIAKPNIYFATKMEIKKKMKENQNNIN